MSNEWYFSEGDLTDYISRHFKNKYAIVNFPSIRTGKCHGPFESQQDALNEAVVWQRKNRHPGTWKFHIFERIYYSPEIRTKKITREAMHLIFCGLSEHRFDDLNELGIRPLIELRLKEKIEDGLSGLIQNDLTWSKMSNWKAHKITISTDEAGFGDYSVRELFDAMQEARSRSDWETANKLEFALQQSTRELIDGYQLPLQLRSFEIEQTNKFRMHIVTSSDWKIGRLERKKSFALCTTKEVVKGLKAKNEDRICTTCFKRLANNVKAIQDLSIKQTRKKK